MKLGLALARAVLKYERQLPKKSAAFDDQVIILAADWDRIVGLAQAVTRRGNGAMIGAAAAVEAGRE